MLVLGRFRRVPPPAQENFTPQVSIILAAHNEQKNIAARLQNFIAANYPRRQLNIIIVSDGSNDDTASIVRAFPSTQIKLLEQPLRLGKSACLNLAATAATGQLIIFCDVRQTFAPDAIQRLANAFLDPQIGAVSGELDIAAANSSIGSGVDAYWRLERSLRAAEAQFDSCIGCTGAIYAIRRELFESIPPDTILDDVVIPMQIAVRGYRVGFDPEARAFDPQTLEPTRENIRKQRTLAGNYQMLFRHPAWLLPWRNRLWWQLISHKYLRLLAPILMIVAFAVNFALMNQPSYFVLFACQCAFYLLAIIGLVFKYAKIRILSLPAGFVFLNWMALKSLWYYLYPPKSTGWAKSSDHV